MTNLSPRMTKALGDWAGTPEAMLSECVECGRGVLFFVGEDRTPMCYSCMAKAHAGEPDGPRRGRNQCRCGRWIACTDHACAVCRWTPPTLQQLYESYVLRMNGDC